jgi:predicted acylesterase/phospholipase RssA/CRP-like cAMP-binding protein
MEKFQVDRVDVTRAVEACGLFASLAAEAHEALIDAFDGLRLTTGEVLMREGEVAESLYVVRHGRLRATVRSAEGDEVVIGEIGKSEVVGEMAVITDQNRSASVFAMRDTDLFRLPADAFGQLIQRHPQMLRPFASVVVNRLRNAMTRPSRPALPATIVLIPAGSDNCDDLAVQLAERFSGYRCRVLRAADAEGRDNLAAWLLDIENAIDISLLVADREPTEWTKLCLRHADRVLLAADDSSSPAPTPIEVDPACKARLAEVPIELVMQYDVRPRTSNWLVGRELEAHYNVKRSEPADLERLARRITGASTVVVLGGGGARGFAHFGLVRALKEAGVPIDAIVGTSAGAVVGGLLARIGDPLEGQREMIDWFAGARWRRDFNPPSVSFMSGRTMTEGLRQLADGLDVEDLPIDFVAVSCDLVSASPYLHVRGPLWQAVRASGSVPGMFPPVAVNGHLLVDGGLVANLPIEIARNRHPNARLIAVDVGDPTDIDLGGLDGSGIVNGWQRLRSRGTGGASLGRLMMRLTELGRHDSAGLADVLITPDVRGFGLIDTKNALKISQRGYEAGLRALESGEIA